MRKIIGIIIIAIISNNLYGQNLGQIMKGTEERTSFNRLSIIIPENWYYSKNPREVPGTDQIQLYSEDQNRTIMITVTNSRPEIDFIEIEHAGRFGMLKRAMSIPGFSNCSVKGITPDEKMWGRKGILSGFELYKDENQNPNEILLKLYNYGEQIVNQNQVLFINAFIIGDDKSDTNKIINSLELLKE